MKTAKDFTELPLEVVETSIVKPKPAKDYLQDYYQSLGDGSIDYLGIKTGLSSLDKATLGLDGLIVLGGIAGQGKTSLALQLAFDACEIGAPVLFYSLEMPKRAIFTKVFSRLSQIKYSDLMLKGRGYLDGTYKEEEKEKEFLDFITIDFFTKTETQRLKEAQGKFEAIADKFYIRSREVGDSEIDFDSVEREINLLKAEHNADKVLVVIDHLQVFQAKEYKDQIDKENKLITGFKGISERTGATLLIISQKNKAGFSGKGRLEEIKGSVDIVYLADLVMFLQEEAEKGKGKGQEQVISSGEISRQIDLVISKNRYNAPTTIHLNFDGAYGIFTEARR